MTYVKHMSWWFWEPAGQGTLSRLHIFFILDFYGLWMQHRLRQQQHYVLSISSHSAEHDVEYLDFMT